MSCSTNIRGNTDAMKSKSDITTGSDHASPRLIDEIDEEDDGITAADSVVVVEQNTANITSTVDTSITKNISATTNTDEAEDSKIRALEEWLRQQEEAEEEVEVATGRRAGGVQRADDGDVVIVPNALNDTTEVDVIQPHPPPPLIPPPEEEAEEAVEVEPPMVIQREEDPLILDHLPPDLIDDILLQQQQQQERLRNTNPHNTKRHYLLTYRPLSFLSFLALIWYALRTRKQYYFTAVYLSHSKYAYVIFGNTIIATAIIVFDIAIYLFFRTTTRTRTNHEPDRQNHPATTTTTGLRIQEAEGLQDFFRWNVTETCLALTMFRYELTIVTAIQFVFLILLKCLHYVAAQREQHLRMTEDVIITTVTNAGTAMDDNEDGNGETHPSRTSKHTIVSYIKSMILFFRSNHTSIIIFFVLLQGIDMYIIQHCIIQIMNAGQPSVKILFAFEAAILLVSTYCHVILYLLHVIDCSIQYGHDVLENAIAKQLLHPWKEYKATFIFAIELQAQAINFLFYCTFFCIVLTFYGLPINLFREVYMSFIKLKERLTSFFHYRQLMASMNRFRTATDEELNESGRTCIICRDEMTSGHDCKRLPICTHTFHKSCLREWLVQQQSCPTCRADIAAMEALEASRTATANAATQRTTTTIDSTNAATTTAKTNPETATTTETSAAAATPSSTTDENQRPSMSVGNTTSTHDVSTPTVERERLENSNKNETLSSSILRNKSLSTKVTFSSTSTVIYTNNDNIGVIQPIPPTLYEVIGTHNSVSIIIDETANDDVPVYAHESIVSKTMSSMTSSDGINATLVPIRTIRKNTLLLGMAKYQTLHHSSTSITASPTLMTFIQLPDQTWILNDYLQSIYILPQKDD